MDKTRRVTVTVVGRLAALAAAGLVACGGGVGEVLAIVGFLGTGGGQYFVDDSPGTPGYQVRSCGFDACALSIQVQGTFDLYATGYPVSVNGPLPNCSNVTGTVEGQSVRLGAGSNCFSGQYVNVNELRSDDGRTVLYYDFLPDLTSGVWVDVNDGTRRLKFSGSTRGCEITAAGTRILNVTVESSNYAEVATNPAAALKPATRITNLSVSGGGIYTGEFIGASGLRLTSGGSSTEFQRRNLSDSC